MKELNVMLHHYGQRVHVGTLAQQDQKTYFEYNSDFLNQAIPLSPYSLPPSLELKEFQNYDYSDIFGAFSDSLPDGWGLLLMDRYLKQEGLPYKGLTSFDRLSYTGKHAMGALEFLPATFADKQSQEAIDLYEMSQNAISIYEGKSEFVISKLAKAGGSPGGARPKIIVTEKADGRFVTDNGCCDRSDKHWLIKFDISKDFQDFSSVEYLYSLLAKAAGIEMPETKLFRDERGSNYFGIKRFDRSNEGKIHTHTFGSLVESNFRFPDQDYKSIMLVALDLTKDIGELYKIFRLMVFNHLVTNQDDHVKNFSFIMDQNHAWKFAPAYDLTPSFGMNAWHSTTINNKGTNITDKDYLDGISGTGLNRKKCEQIIEEVRTGIATINELHDLVTKNDFKRLTSEYILL